MDSGDITQIIVAVIGFAGLAWGGYVTLFGAKKTGETSVTDQWERLSRDDRARLTALEKRMDASVIRERALLDYVEQLRRHISDGLPPPPPKWPDVLLRAHLED